MKGMRLEELLSHNGTKVKVENGEVAKAAAVYAWAGSMDKLTDGVRSRMRRIWPWPWRHFKSYDRLQDLQTARKLIEHEIARLEHAE